MVLALSPASSAASQGSCVDRTRRIGLQMQTRRAANVGLAAGDLNVVVRYDVGGGARRGN